MVDLHVSRAGDPGGLVARKDKKDKGPSLIPSDDPFAPPPTSRAGAAAGGDAPSGEAKPKRQLFGRKKPKAAPDPFADPPRLEDVGATDPWSLGAPTPDPTTEIAPEGRSEPPSPDPASPAVGDRPARRPLVTPWASSANDPSTPPPVETETEAAGLEIEPPPPVEPRPRRAAFPPRTEPAEPPRLAYPPALATPSVPDPNEHEMEFVFGAGTAAAPTVRRTTETVVTTPAGPPSQGRQISRSTLILLAVLLALIAAVVGYALLSGGDDDPEPTIAPQTVPPTTAPTTAPTVAPAALSEECANAFLYAQANPQPPTNVTRTGDLCPTVDGWLAGARQQPGAIGASSATEVGEDDVRSFCTNAPQSAMCQDAERKGVLAGAATSVPSPVTAPSASANATSTATQAP
jgi:hypothetical protein